MRFSSIEFLDSLFYQLADHVTVVLALALYEDAVDGLGKGADYWPELDLVLCDEGYGGVFEGDVEGIEPTAMVAYYYRCLDTLAFGI